MGSCPHTPLSTPCASVICWCGRKLTRCPLEKSSLLQEPQYLNSSVLCVHERGVCMYVYAHVCVGSHRPVWMESRGGTEGLPFSLSALIL